MNGTEPEADEVYRVTAHWRPHPQHDLAEPTTDTITGWPAARRAALKLTCLRGTIAVTVHDTDGDLVAHWDGYSNRWHEREKGVEVKATERVYVVVISDRHSDTDVEIFTTADTAIAYAKAAATEYCRHPQDFAEEQIDGWLYYARYSCEGDNVRVIEKTLRTNGDDE